MLENILSKLGASTKITVGVAVSPNVGLEMVEIDRFSNTITKYGSKPLDYNHSSREIADYSQFQTSLEELFDDLEISPKSNIILCLPNVHFGMISLPLLLTDEAITNAVISNVEQSYIFKRQEPTVSWSEVLSNNDTENRTMVYSAIQQSAIDEIIQVCSAIGCTVAAIETNYSALLRGLAYTDVAREQMKEGTTWNLMVIGQNSYSILSMLDKRVLEYYEEPLALKSFMDDEIYNAIITSAMLTLAGLPANHMLIVSETDLVSAEVLSMKMSNESHIDFLECNKFAQNELMPVNISVLPDIANQITPEVIGAVVYPYYDFPLKLNLTADIEIALSGEAQIAPKINLGNLEIELTPAFIKKSALILSGAILAPMLLIFILLSTIFVPKEQAKLDELNKKIESINAEIQQFENANKSDAFDLNGAIQKIITENKTKLGYYSAMGMSIPNNLWVTYYSTNEEGKVDIKGKANSVSSIYSFYKGIKELINDSDIRLYKLEISSESIDDIITNAAAPPKNYTFEITNMSEAELNPQAAGAQPATPDPSQAQPQPAASPAPFQIGQPLFGPKNNANPTPAPSPLPTPPTKVQSSNGGLPSNLKSIEKF